MSPKAHFLMILVSLWGTFGESFGDMFSFFLDRDFDVISSMFPASIFDGFGSLRGTIWHHFCDFLVVLGFGENGGPAGTGAMFGVF